MQNMEMNNQQMKLCKHCGAQIPVQAVICTSCGGQVEELKQTQAQQPSIVINNENTNVNQNTNVVGGGGYGRMRNKWAAFFLCLFLGYLGAHKFYEGKTGQGILYLLTAGLFGIGWIVDTLILLFKPNPYYV